MTISESAVPSSPSKTKAQLTFSDLGLSPPLLQAIEELHYTTPTPIQQQAIPSILMTRDILGIAQTGTGKTGSFLLPLLEILSTSASRARLPRALILEPTRELALQVAGNLAEYSKYLKLRYALLIGGENISAQKEQLAQAPDILIATPGRLCDLFERGLLLLNHVNILIIDEADRMLDMGFIPDIEKIAKFLTNRRQTLLFSATMVPSISKIAHRFLHNPKKIVIAKNASISKTIDDVLIMLKDKRQKKSALEHIIQEDQIKNAIIFCNRKTEVDSLTRWLTREGFSAASLHGSKHQSVRFETLEKFRDGKIQFLVCTDIAARGIDIDTLSHVINYDIPLHSEDYVHRIGRTGRAGSQGKAYSLAIPADKPIIEDIEKLTQKKIQKQNYNLRKPQRTQSKSKNSKTLAPEEKDDLTPGFGSHVPSFMKNM